MAYYQYYQQQPNYGTSSYQLVQPPSPTYRPQPSWTGSDYYRAHAYGGSYDDLDARRSMMRGGGSPGPADNNIFDWVWGRVKSIVGGGGVSRDEARHWHKRVYGGMVDITQLLPTELGAAAGYEAVRLWEHHHAVYRSPLMDDREREREALVGLAIGEATKLWSYCNRPRDKYGRREASEVAAATAERIYRHKYERNGMSSYDAYDTVSRRARDGGLGYFDDDDLNYGHQHQHQHHSHHRRRRSSGAYGSLMPAQSYNGSTALAIAAPPRSTSSALTIPAAVGYASPAYTPDPYSPYPATTPYSAGGYSPTYASPTYAGASPPLVVSSASYGGGYGSHGSHRHRRQSVSYAAPGYRYM
ncbi:hypothetical protein BOTBODRAFT_169123 [Botryobasidium botryosum FD-172 SS1]|uniref:Uncharacterized protein n=1 Tax=Botryobasidium botryosum (strain FD-172 SS1) TaxID=930990 RepID=A0A067N277_BOTB1|nr:hypothetical protein BOTBODRAFT_169123 [Botryobasidium botryosum FD-172 SS1]